MAASILAVILIGGYLATRAGGGGATVEFLVHAVLLGVAFWFPAVRIGRPADLRTHGRSLVVWLVAWTLVWDLATAGIAGTRTPFQEWWLVYPSGVIVIGALLFLHAVAVRQLAADGSESGD